MSTVPVFPLRNRGRLHARAIRGRDTMPGREGAARVCPPPPPESVLSNVHCLRFLCRQRGFRLFVGVHSTRVGVLELVYCITAEDDPAGFSHSLPAVPAASRAVRARASHRQGSEPNPAPGPSLLPLVSRVGEGPRKENEPGAVGKRATT